MITNEALDATLHALAHTTRREILDRVQDSPGLTVGGLAAYFEISRIAIMNHLSVLERADLIISEKDGRARRLYLNVMPIQEIHERWTDTYSAYWTDRMIEVKAAAEAATAHAIKSDSSSDARSITRKRTKGDRKSANKRSNR